MAHATVKGTAFSWHHVTRPTAADLAFIAKHFPLDEVDAQTLRDGVDLPRMHDRDDWHMLAFHIPELASAKSDMLRATVYVLVNAKTVVTVVDRQTRLSRVFDVVKKRGAHAKLEHGNTLEVVAWLLGEVCDGLDEVLDALYVRIGALEHRIAKTHASSGYELAALRRDALVLDLMVDPAEAVIAQILHTRLPYRGMTAHGRMVHIHDRLHGMHIVLQHYLKLLENMSRLYESTLAHRTSRTVQVLTVLSVLLMPPTLIASYYGMNIANLPFAHDFRIVSLFLLGAVIIFLLVVFVMTRKR